MAVFTVTTTADVVNANDNLLSLREAMALANAAAGADSIVFGTGLNGATLQLTSTITVAGGETVSINGDIDGDGTADVTINSSIGGSFPQTDGASFVVSATASARFSNLVFTGTLTGDSSLSPGQQGGNAAVIVNNGTAQVEGSTFRITGLTGGNGGPGTPDGAQNGGGGGNAAIILNTGSLTVADSHLAVANASGGIGARGDDASAPFTRAGNGGNGGAAALILNFGTTTIDGLVTGNGAFTGGAAGAGGTATNGTNANGSAGNPGATGLVVNAGGTVSGSVSANSVGSVRILGDSLTVNEGGDSGTFTATITLVRTGDVSANLSAVVGFSLPQNTVADLDAADFNGALPGSQTVNFGAGSDRATVTLTFLRDDLAEGNEFINAKITGVVGDAAVDLTRLFRITVVDDDNGTSLVDTLGPSTGTDSINGLGGDDIIVIDGPAAIVTGDIIDGGTGVDTLRIDGNEAYDFRAGSVSRIEIINFDSGQLGDDKAVILDAADFANIISNLRVFYDAQGASALRIDMGTVTSFSAAGFEFSNETADDRLVINGDNSNETITGGAGRSHLFGNGGADTLNGGTGNDILNGGTGTDTASYAGLGFSAADGVTISLSFGGGTGGGGFTQNMGSAGGADQLTSIENLIGTSFNDTLTGDSLANVLDGGLGKDTLNGGADGVIDTLKGGAGDDTYVLGASANDVVTETNLAGSGIDTITSTISRTSLAANVENLTLLGTANINATGNAARNILTGNSGNNILTGGVDSVQDRLVGGAGNDTYALSAATLAATVDIVVEAAGAAGGLDTITTSASRSLAGFANVENLTLLTGALTGTGNTLANTIIGNSAANTLNGGLGNDVLTGGAGADSFVFNTSLYTPNIDRITDFTTADTIRLENTGIGLFDALANGELNRDFFKANKAGAATDLDDRIIYDTDSGALYYDSNGSALGGKVQFATLAPNLALTAEDFVVF